jgi:hypothetical protein
VALDLDLDRGVKPAREGVRAARIEDPEPSRSGSAAGQVVQPLVELANGCRPEVDDLELGCLRHRDVHQTFAFSQT